MSEKHGTIYWSELITHDVDAARNYFEKVAGWTFTTVQMPEGPYQMGSIGGNNFTGIMDIKLHPEMKDMETFWLTSITVDDVDATVAQTRELGGKIIREPFEVPGMARIAIVSDPSGGIVGFVTPLANEVNAQS
ncbi:MAG: VOC family protein [Bacteroidota bacterium]